jgi:hypothetical protein
MSTLTSVKAEIEFRLDAPVQTADHRGTPFNASTVEWRHYVDTDGHDFLTLVAFGTEADGTSSNHTWYARWDATPEWAPTPPTGWNATVLAFVAEHANEAARAIAPIMPEPDDWTVKGGYSASGNTWLCPDCGFGVGGLLAPADPDELYDLDPVGDHVASHSSVAAS